MMFKYFHCLMIEAKRDLIKYILLLIVSLNLGSFAYAQQVVVITGARLVEDGSGGGGGGDGCQRKIHSVDLQQVERNVVGNCYTPFPIEFDPNTGNIFAREGSNDARCIKGNNALKTVTSQSSASDRKKVAQYVMNQFDLGNGWGATAGQTSLKVIYADGGYDFWGIEKSSFVSGFKVLDVVRSSPSDGQIKPRTTPCA